MSNLVYILIIVILFLFCCVLAWKLYRYSLIIIEYEDSLEESLEILDEKYGNINKILQTPVFFDSIEVRQVISDIRSCHDTILIIANRLTNNMGSISGTKEEN